MLRVLPSRRWRVAPSWSQVVPWTLVAVALAVVLRLPFVSVFPSADEGGLLLIARHWHAGGPELYGNLFVDRPPLLLVFWRLANLLGGVDAARWLALGAVSLLVVSAAWAGYLVGGQRGARWAGLTAAALCATPLLDVQEIIGELLAVPLVMLSCALILTAVQRGRGPRWQLAWAFAAGVAGAAALLMKQNFVDALVFGAVLVLLLRLRGKVSTAPALRLLAAGAIGAAVPIGATMLWAATSGPGLAVLWYTLFGFRADAADVIAMGKLNADAHRLLHLLIVAVVSGLVPLLAGYLWLARRRFRDKDPASLALLAMLAVEVVSVVLGGSFWSHYLVALIPSAALAAGFIPRLVQRPLAWPRPVFAFVLASAIAATAVTASGSYSESLASGSNTAAPAAERALVRWLRTAHRPGDSAFVAYGQANIIEASGLQPSRYPYLWSLELRTEDPHLSRLIRSVSGPSAPTWVIAWMRWNDWQIDPHGAFRTAVHHHYKRAGTFCGAKVFIHDGVSRRLPPVPAVCSHFTRA